MPLYLPLSTRKAAAIRQPKEITSFSTNIKNETILDDSSLSYYYFPETILDSTKIDLAGGYTSFTQKNDSIDSHLDPLLKSIIAYENKIGEKVKTDIITWRGIMTRLLVLPYNNDEDFDLNLEYFDGQIFIEEDHELHESKKRTLDEKNKVMSYSGYKFEAVTTLPRPWGACSRQEIEARYQSPVNNIEQYCSVVRTGVGSVKLVFGGEVDCISDYKPESGNPLDHYVELKTTKTIENDKDAQNFERKIFKAWAQSFLLGVPKIVYGFRDRNGFLSSVEEYKTESFPTMIKESKYLPPSKKWNGNDAISWYAALLDWIVKVVKGGEDGSRWRLTYSAGKKHVELAKNPNGSDFLLDEFLRHRRGFLAATASAD